MAIEEGYDIEQSGSACPPKVNQADPNQSGNYDSVARGKASSPCGSTDPDHDEGACEDCCYYTSDVPNTVTVGGLIEGETYSNVHIHQMWFDLTHPYINPEPDLTISPTILEVGEQVGIVNLTWASTQIDNVKPNSGTILVSGWNDYNSWQVKISNLAIPDAKTEGFTPTLVKTDYDRVRFMFEEQNTKDQYLATEKSMWWYWPIYYGVRQETELTGSQIITLSKDLESPSWKGGTWVLNGPGYKYFAIPMSYDIPVTIKEKETGFGLAVASINDGYNEGPNDYYSYKLVYVTNAFGVTAPYRLYRSTNYLNDDKNFLIT